MFNSTITTRLKQIDKRISAVARLAGHLCYLSSEIEHLYTGDNDTTLWRIPKHEFQRMKRLHKITDKLLAHNKRLCRRRSLIETGRL